MTYPGYLVGGVQSYFFDGQDEDHRRSKQVRVQLPTSADNVTLLAFAAAHRAAARPLLTAGRAAIDRYLLHAGAQQQTRRSEPQRPNDGKDGQTRVIVLGTGTGTGT